MFEKVLSSKTKKVLATLGRKKFVTDFYLAGGTALALELGHRTSIDLDFFSDKEFKTKTIIHHLSDLGNFVLENESWGTVSGQLDQVNLDFLFYEHKLLKLTKEHLGIKIAHPIDIGLMKITALGLRGSRKDFIDLYFICQKIISLKKLFSLLPKKFKKVKYEPYHLILGLTYFKDADKEAMPRMLSDVNWSEVKKYFQVQSRNLIK